MDFEAGRNEKVNYIYYFERYRIFFEVRVFSKSANTKNDSLDFESGIPYEYFVDKKQNPFLISKNQNTNFFLKN